MQKTIFKSIYCLIVFAFLAGCSSNSSPSNDCKNLIGSKAAHKLEGKEKLSEEEMEKYKIFFVGINEEDIEKYEVWSKTAIEPFEFYCAVNDDLGKVFMSINYKEVRKFKVSGF